MTKEVDFIQVSSGRCVHFLDPKPEDFDINDIAHALAFLCRFGGHCQDFYSVAEHSVRACWLAQDMKLDKKLILEALLHDATEAYLVDMPRPIKQVLSEYRSIESALDKNIRIAFDLPEKVSPEIKEIDNILLATEKRDLMTSSDEEWSKLPDPLGSKIKPWDWKRARNVFLLTYDVVRNR